MKYLIYFLYTTFVLAIEKEITIENGVVRGMEDKSANGRTFLSFLGIPFAKPPVGELRFKNPVKPDSWDGVRDGTKMPEKCLQKIPFPPVKHMTGKEDCLYLNVNVPKVEKKNLPTMVFIHGGGFFCSGAEDYSPMALMDHDIVLVIIQYRLGALGFYSTEDDVFPGNYGMKDQVMALQWVKDNIANFNGDPGRITIFGESAGGAAAYYHLLSPMSKGLFSGVIAQSGNAVGPWTLKENARQEMLDIASELDCHPGPDFLKCMQEVEIEKLHNATLPGAVGIRFAPRLDGEFLKEDPKILVREGRFARVNLMMGVTADEGAYMLSNIPGLIDLYNQDAEKALLIENESNPENILQLFKEQYFDGGDFPENATEGLKKLVEDRIFYYPHQLAAKFHAQHCHEVFLYELEFPPQFSLTGPDNAPLPNGMVEHAADLVFLFGIGGIFNKTLTDKDNIKVMNIMTKLWANFAETGNPTADESWKPVKDKFNLDYFSIKVQPEMRKNHRREMLDWWKALPLKENEVLFGSKCKAKRKEEL